MVRLKGYRTKPPADYVPRYLLQMQPEQKHAVVVDTCLLYTSDAADERSSVDLGGRRIIKKKNSVELG